MTDMPTDGVDRPRRSRVAWPTRLIASRRFQRWAAGFWPTRGIVRREGEQLFGLLSGFCQSQVLMALVQLDIPRMLLERPLSIADISQRTRVPQQRMQVLLRASVALKLIKPKKRGDYALTRRGAALAGVPGLSEMIQHHDILYRDLADPAAFFRGDTETELASFWPYVFGGDMDPHVAATYSDLMAQSQVLVAEDTLRSLDFSGIETLMDIGGGSGAFLAHVSQSYPKLNLMLFDLPEVAPAATSRFATMGISARAQIKCGSFVEDPIPDTADAISLVRVLYDHNDETVTALLSKCYGALPSGGRLLISEPMTGGARPEIAGDVYFALYTMAMQTGRARSVDEISILCEAAGFEVVQAPKPYRPFVTRCLEVRKP